MDAKLTLKLDHAVTQRAKALAAERKTSLSSLVENYFRNLTAPPAKSARPRGIVAELAGIASNRDQADLERDYADYLAEKYR